MGETVGLCNQEKDIINEDMAIIEADLQLIGDMKDKMITELENTRNINKENKTQFEKETQREDRATGKSRN